MVKMGLQFGLNGENLCPKRSNRWLFKVDGVSADDNSGVSALPPSKSARPSIKFKETPVKHLIEDVYYPAKPEWTTIKLTLFDLKMDNHPVWEWLRIFYDPAKGTLNEPNYVRPNTSTTTGNVIKPDKFIQNSCRLELYNGCGDLIERWIYEDVWPQMIDFQDLDMGSSDILYCDLTLRYARAYLED